MAILKNDVKCIPNNKILFFSDGTLINRGHVYEVTRVQKDPCHGFNGSMEK